MRRHAAGVTIGPVYDIAQIVQDDYVLEREALIEIPDEEAEKITTVQLAIDYASKHQKA